MWYGFGAFYTQFLGTWDKPTCHFNALYYCIFIDNYCLQAFQVNKYTLQQMECILTPFSNNINLESKI